MQASCQGPKQTFSGRRAVFTGKQHFTSPPAAVFPMLCPVREYDYIPPWECDVVFLESGLAEDGGVFTTSFPSDGEGATALDTPRTHPGHIQVPLEPSGSVWKPPWKRRRYRPGRGSGE